ANGLLVAYVPVAMEAVSVPFIIIPPTGCSQSDGAGTVADPYGCTLLPTMNMSPSTLQTVFEGASSNWSIPAIEQDNGGQGFVSTVTEGVPFPATLVDADASTGSLVSYFLSNPQAESAWDQWAGQAYGTPANTVVYEWPKRAPTGAG